MPFLQKNKFHITIGTSPCSLKHGILVDSWIIHILSGILPFKWKTSKAVQHIQASRVGALLLIQCSCLPWMHLHWVSQQEATEGNVNPSRFVNSAKIHPFQYIYTPFSLQVESAVVFLIQSYYLKSTRWAGACWAMSAPMEGPLPCLCHPWPAGGWGACGCWRGMRMLCLLPCQVPFAPDDKLRHPCQGVLAQPLCPVPRSTAIPKWHHVQQSLTYAERLLLQILGRIWISVMLRSQTLIDLYPGLFAKTFDPNIQTSGSGCFRPPPAGLPYLRNSCCPRWELHMSLTSQCSSQSLIHNPEKAFKICTQGSGGI